jgi:hypothetical protein
MRVDRKNLRTPAGQQHLFVADMAEEHASVRQFGEGDPLR